MQFDARKKIDIKRLIVTLLMLLLTFGVTALARIDLDFIKHAGPAGTPAGAYLSLGDVCVYLNVLVLGGPLGILVSAAGSMLADWAVGSTAYIIGSILIKSAMALFLAAFCARCDTWKRCLVIAALTETIMVVGYFFYALIIMAEYLVAAQSLPLDIVQGLVCGALGMVALRLIRPLRPDKLFTVRRTR